MPKCAAKSHSRGCSGASIADNGIRDLPNSDLQAFWKSLPMERRKSLLSVNRKSLFTRIRQQFCSRCFGEAAHFFSDYGNTDNYRTEFFCCLFVLRYEELKGAAALDCPACQEFYAGLAVSDSGDIAVESSVIETEPFTLFAEGKLRERERDMQFMTGDICGSGYQKRPGNTMCALHSSLVPNEALLEYFSELPQEHKAALLTLREEDFAAELDAHLKYQLRICRDCRCNVMRVYRDLKPAAKGQAADQPSLELCPEFNLKVAERLVSVEGQGVSEFFNRADEVEGCKAADFEDAYFDDPDHVRHAETPELAREALVDSAVLIYKSQIEVSFREQTAGHNALLLFVGLALQLMEEQLDNAFKELGAKEAEAELLDLVAKEKEKKESGKQKKKGKKLNVKVVTKESSENECNRSQAQSDSRCSQCSALQQCSTCLGRSAASPIRALPVFPLRSKRASPVRVPRAVPAAVEAHKDADAGWEVHLPKKRGTVQTLKKTAVSLGGSSSESASPERSSRLSMESARSRSPFSRRVAVPVPVAAAVVPPPEPPKRSQLGQRPLAVPVHAFTCSSAVPPPPPPPREPRVKAAAETAWQIPGKIRVVKQASGSWTAKPGAAAQDWSPWSGRSPALCNQMAAPTANPSRLSSCSGQREDADCDLLSEFSLFHFSPVPQAAGPLASSEGATKSSAGYQLFGGSHSSYPLAPLAPVISL